jgi:hypothetical protein
MDGLALVQVPVLYCTFFPVVLILNFNNNFPDLRPMLDFCTIVHNLSCISYELGHFISKPNFEYCLGYKTVKGCSI